MEKSLDIASILLERGVTRRKYASSLCDLLAHLQVTAVQLFGPQNGETNKEALIKAMQRCKIESEETLSRARPYLTKIEIVAIKTYVRRTFYNHQSWQRIVFEKEENARYRTSRLVRVSYFSDEDQAKGVAKQMYDEAQKYLSFNGAMRLWLYIVPLLKR